MTRSILLRKVLPPVLLMVALFIGRGDALTDIEVTDLTKAELSNVVEKSAHMEVADETMPVGTPPDVTKTTGYPFVGSVQSQPESFATENLIFITLDGLRWEELFTGIDSLLLNNSDYTGDPEALGDAFWRESPELRRELLMPFFWEVIASEGQLYGNRLLGCQADVTNRHRFSYPGYNEILTGFADDDRVDSNQKIPNPNTTVLEFINRQPGFEGEVAAFASWDVFPYILNEQRSGLPVNAGFRKASAEPLSDREIFLNELQEQVPSPWGAVRLDAFTHHYALEYLKKEQPRLIYIAYGDTDDFAHDGNYDDYIRGANRTDHFIRELWEFAQSHPQYRGKTTFIITTDHGRGRGDDWRHHGSQIERADEIWMAILGPDSSARGEVDECRVYQNQIARTIAALLGLEYEGDPEGGRPAGEIIHEMIQ